MNLSKFIRENIAWIASEWETAASGRISAPEATSCQVRRTASSRLEPVLAVMALRLDDSAPPGGGVDDTAARHGALRHAQGYSLPDLVADFGAMREVVLRAWMADGMGRDTAVLGGMPRLCTVVDGMLAEAVAGYSEQVERSRHLFLNVLGHDLRSPLAAIAMGGQYLSAPGRGDAAQLKVADSIVRSAGMMSAMIRDLVEYSRVRMGRSLQLSPKKEENLAEICQAAVSEAQSRHPECEFLFRGSGDLRGCFDRKRMRQVLGSLLDNTVRQGTRRLPVVLEARGDETAVMVLLKNRGSLIPPVSLASIFEPLIPLSEDAQADDLPAMGLGIGLFVARELVRAHGGTIEALSSEAEGMVFVLRLPRESVPPA